MDDWDTAAMKEDVEAVDSLGIRLSEILHGQKMGVVVRLLIARLVRVAAASSAEERKDLLAVMRSCSRMVSCMGSYSENEVLCSIYWPAIHPRREKPEWTPKVVGELRRLVREGLPWRLLEGTFGVREETLRRKIREAGRIRNR